MGSTAAVVRANPTANFAYMNVPPAKDSAPRNQPVSQPSFIIIRAVAIGKPRVGLRMKVWPRWTNLWVTDTRERRPEAQVAQTTGKGYGVSEELKGFSA